MKILCIAVLLPLGVSRLLMAAPDVVCAPSTPLAIAGTAVTLTAAFDVAGATPVWRVSAGRIEGSVWLLQGVQAGPQTADLDLSLRGRVIAHCSVEVQIVELPPPPPPPSGAVAQAGYSPLPRSSPAASPAMDDGEGPPPVLAGSGSQPRPTAHALLAPDQAEGAGFGLYSYLIFGSAPRDSSKEQYRKILEACLRLMPATQELEKYIPAGRMNSMFIPITSSAGLAADPGWLLTNYDYARAKAWLTRIPGAKNTGIYIVSSSAPLLSPKAAGPYLVQNLTDIPADLTSTWVTAFINQAAQQRFWEPTTSAALVLKLRLSLAILAQGVPDVKTAVASWISIKN